MERLVFIDLSDSCIHLFVATSRTLFRIPIHRLVLLSAVGSGWIWKYLFPRFPLFHPVAIDGCNPNCDLGDWNQYLDVVESASEKKSHHLGSVDFLWTDFFNHLFPKWSGSYFSRLFFQRMDVAPSLLLVSASNQIQKCNGIICRNCVFCTCSPLPVFG